MKITIVGPGSVGGYLAGTLAKAGHEVMALGRKGSHLDALRANGLQLAVGNGEYETIPLQATDDATTIGTVDWVFLTVKGQDVPATADAIQPLLGTHTPVVHIANGIPWWYGHKLGGAHDGKPIQVVDPEQNLYQRIGAERIIGGVTNVAASAPKPGHVHMKVEQWFRFGEPSNAMTERLQTLCTLLNDAGIDAQPREDIRSDIWHKLWGNAFYNPMSVLTGATIEQMTDDPAIKPMIVAVMEEVRTVAEAFGIQSLNGIEKRIDIARKLGAHKTSMLQDWEAGKPLESGALTGAILEIAMWAGLDVPQLSMLHRLVEKKQQVRDDHAQRR